MVGHGGAAPRYITHNGIRYSEAQLRALVDSASRLGFWDDVMHFGRLLSQLRTGRM